MADDVNVDEQDEETHTDADEDVDLSTAEEQGNLPGDDESPDYSGNPEEYGSDQ